MYQSSKSDLKEFITQCKQRLGKIFDRLEWSEELTLKSFNTNSVCSCLKEEEKNCRSSNRATYPDSCITENSIVLETSKLQELLQDEEVKAPHNFTELQIYFSREQKLKIYEYVIENTLKLNNNTLEQAAKGEIPLADILAEKKLEEKRKKRRFRKSRPTHIEEVRYLVEMQMQALQQFMDNKMKKERNEGVTDKVENKRNGRKYYEDYYRRERNREKIIEYSNKTDSLERRHRSRSKEHIRHGHKRHEESSKACHSKIIVKENCNKECRRKRSGRSRSRSKSNSKERRKRERSHSSERYRRSNIREISRKRSKRRSRSSERHRRKKENKNHHKYANEKNYYNYLESKNGGDSPESNSFMHKNISMLKSRYSDEHKRSHQAKAAETTANLEGSRYVKDYQPPNSREEISSSYKGYTHKRKKRRSDS